MCEAGKDEGCCLEAMTVHVILDNDLNPEVGVIGHRNAQEQEQHGVDRLPDECNGLGMTETGHRRKRPGEPETKDCQGNTGHTLSPPVLCAVFCRSETEYPAKR